MLLRHLRFRSAICSRNTRVFTHCRNLSTKPLHSSALFRLIGSGACGDSSSFYLQAHDTRYIFNCGEGVARLAQANGIRLTTVQNVFFTQTKWRQLGGLGTLLRMIWEQNIARIDMHGPRPLAAITKRILAATNFPPDWEICKFNETNVVYEDSAIRIEFFSLRSNGAKENADTAMAYYCELKSVHGVRFQGFLSSARFEQHSFGIDGEIFDEFKEPRGFRFLVLDVPSIDFVDNLELVQKQLAKVASQNRLDLMIHFSPQHIIGVPEYEKFIERTIAMRHFKLNESNQFSNLLAPHEMQSQLNELDPNIFPMLRSGNGTDPPIRDNERAKVYPKIVFLGTGSKISRDLRNVTSILVHASRNNCILLDCGEGTCSQISRFYGDQSVEIIRKIKTVFISHMHADHYFGLLRLMELRKEVMHESREPLIVLCPKSEMKSWLFFYDNHVDAIHDDLMLIDNRSLTYGDGLSSYISKQINVKALKTCKVRHTEKSYAIALILYSSLPGWEPFKLTFSGDTLPCDDLVKLGNGSTLLIHEATLPDSMPPNDILHSTMSQAIEQGRKMNAKFNVLTHFSQTIPWSERELDTNVGIAFDNMELIESDLCKLNAIYSKIKNIFRKDSVKNQKRAPKK